MAKEFYRNLCFEIETSKLLSLRCLLGDFVTPNPALTIKFYTALGVEILLQAEADTLCTRTVIDYYPTFSYKLEGGAISQASNPSNDAYVSAFAAPDIPEIAGGSIPMLLNYNLKLAPLFTTIAPPKLTDIDYDPVYASSKIRFRIDHDAGFKHRVMGLLRYTL